MKFVLITQEVCPRCDRAKKLLKELQKEIPFEWREVDLYEMLDTLTYLGIATTPVLLIDREDEDYSEEDVVFMGELPRKWRLKEIIENLTVKHAKAGG
ncbi:MAG: glutaredoxin [Aquificae bacterium]|nr:glutaredoxin [Aquificota bacterium]